MVIRKINVKITLEPEISVDNQSTLLRAPSAPLCGSVGAICSVLEWPPFPMGPPRFPHLVGRDCGGSFAASASQPLGHVLSVAFGAPEPVVISAAQPHRTVLGNGYPEPAVHPYLPGVLQWWISQQVCLRPHPFRGFARVMCVPPNTDIYKSNLPARHTALRLFVGSPLTSKVFTLRCCPADLH